MKSDFILEEETYQIIGSAMEVHRVLGCGFQEAVYQDALEIEFEEQGIPNTREALLVPSYKGRPLKRTYFVDFVCFDEIIVELKALSSITQDHYAQVLNYLKASGLRLGLLINFGAKSLEYKRIIL